MNENNQTDILTSLFLLTQAIGERFLYEIENDYIRQATQLPEYEAAKKKHGLVATRQKLRQVTHSAIDSAVKCKAQREQFVKIWRAVDKLHQLYDEHSDLAICLDPGAAIEAKMKDENITAGDMFEALTVDANFHAKTLLLLWDLRNYMSDLQIECLLRNAAKGPQEVTAETLKRFNAQ